VSGMEFNGTGVKPGYAGVRNALSQSEWWDTGMGQCRVCHCWCWYGAETSSRAMDGTGQMNCRQQSRARCSTRPEHAQRTGDGGCCCCCRRTYPSHPTAFNRRLLLGNSHFSRAIQLYQIPPIPSRPRPKALAIFFSVDARYRSTGQSARKSSSVPS
jgi:hypothetical protein